MRYSVLSGVLPELTVEQVVQTLQRHGYDGVEWRVNGEYHFPAARIDRDAEKIKKLCAEHDLEVSCLMTYVRPDEDDAIRRLVTACQTIGCPRFRIFGALYDPAIGYWELHRDLVAKLQATERLLAGTGVKALLEIHFGTIFCSPSLAYDLLRHLDPATIGVILDPANMVIEGSMNLRMGLDILQDYLDHVHVKNVSWQRTADGKWRWQFDDLQTGACDWAAVVSALKAIGYDGWLSFESLHHVPVKHTGYVADQIFDPDAPVRDIDQRLSAELAYIKRLVAS
jgi:sugar phosphate isomerase/epimerase